MKLKYSYSLTLALLIFPFLFSIVHSDTAPFRLAFRNNIPESCVHQEWAGDWSIASANFDRSGVPTHALAAFHEDSGLSINLTFNTTAQNITDAFQTVILVRSTEYNIWKLRNARKAYNDGTRWVSVRLVLFLNRVAVDGSSGESVKKYVGIGDPHADESFKPFVFVNQFADFQELLVALTLNDEMRVWLYAVGNEYEKIELADKMFVVKTNGLGDSLLRHLQSVLTRVESGDFKIECQAG